MNIEFGVGVCGIKLGMESEDIIKILGMPDKINIDEDDDTYEQMFIYNKQMMTVWFERSNKLRATLIQCFSPDVKVFGEKVFMKSKKTIIEFMKKNGFSKYEEMEEVTEEALYYEDISAWFNFEFDRLSYIEFTMLTGNGDNIYWPYNAE